MSKKIDKVDVILTSDWHIMEHTPPCRIDDFLKTQLFKINQIKQLQHKYKCPIWHAGDLFEKARPSLYLLKRILKYFPEQFNTIFGNHDMPEHNMELWDKSGVGLLYETKVIDLFRGKNYGQKEPSYFTFKNRKILITHEMVWQGKEPWPGCTDPRIEELFNIYPEPDLILVGHNHKTMVVEKNDRLIVNPGSLTRHKADQMDHKPCVFLYDTAKNKAITHYLNINEGVMSREHIDVQKSKDLQLQKFVDSLRTKKAKSISFEKNVEILLNQNKISNKLQQIIKGWME